MNNPCKNCQHCARTELPEVKYCKKNHYYPNPIIIKVFGCSDKELNYFSVLSGEKGEK